MLALTRILLIIALTACSSDSTDRGTDAAPDAAEVDATTNLVDAGPCTCTGSTEETRDVSASCGDYVETRQCEGCFWGEWRSNAPDCECTPGNAGKERFVDGGEGCQKGRRSEQEQCRGDGSGYDWVGTSDFDGSSKTCEREAVESQSVEGQCRSYQRTRICSVSCEWGDWQGEERPCFPEQKYVGQACGASGMCQCKDAGQDTCAAPYACNADEAWSDASCPGQGVSCCEPLENDCNLEANQCTDRSNNTVCRGDNALVACGTGGNRQCTCDGNNSWVDCGNCV